MIEYVDRHITSRQKISGGQARIRTLEADGSRFTVCPLCPLGYLPCQQPNVLAVHSSSTIRNRENEMVGENTDTRPFLPAAPGEKGISRFTLTSYGPFLETVDYIVTWRNSQATAGEEKQWNVHSMGSIG